MSKTDKDRPLRLQELDRLVPRLLSHDHSVGECRVGTLADWQHRYGTKVDANLTGKAGYYRIPCDYKLPWYLSYSMHESRVPREYVLVCWERPARRRSRGQCRDAMRDYNHNGQTDIEVEPYRPRNQARYAWS